MAKIEWTEKTWNPLVGCSRVSEGYTFQVLTKRPARMADYAQALADGRRGLPPV